MEALATALKDDKRELTSTIASLEESKRLLSQSLQEQTERSVVLETESSRLRSMEDEKLLLSKAVEEKESKIGALNAELSSLRDREERRKDDLAALEERLFSNDSDYNASLIVFQSKLDRLALERNEALHSLHVSQLQMELQSKTIEQLELSISHKKENDGALMATVLQLEEKLRKANIENQKKINMFKVEDKDKTNLIETLNDELKVKTQLIDAISEEREVSLKDIHELQVSLENEKNSLKAVRLDLQTALQRDAESNETINLLRSQLQDSRVEVSELQKAMNE